MKAYGFAQVVGEYHFLIYGILNKRGTTHETRFEYGRFVLLSY